MTHLFTTASIPLIGIIFVALVIFLKIFWTVIQWEVAFDMRMLSFGFHAFLLGAAVAVALLAWFGYLPILHQG